MKTDYMYLRGHVNIFWTCKARKLLEMHRRLRNPLLKVVLVCRVSVKFNIRDLDRAPGLHPSELGLGLFGRELLIVRRHLFDGNVEGFVVFFLWRKRTEFYWFFPSSSDYFIKVVEIYEQQTGASTLFLFFQKTLQDCLINILNIARIILSAVRLRLFA